MNLHESTDLFREVINAASGHFGIREVFIEKDYWVTYILKNISQSPHYPHVVFKGGTSLSKAHRLIERFSEDVDLAVITDADMTANQIKQRLRTIGKGITTGLTEIHDPARTSKGSKIRKTLHAYNKVTQLNDFAQASDHVFLEINSFTRPHPYTPKEITSFIRDFLMEKEPSLTKEHGLTPFTINVLDVERTCVEKILALVRASWADDPIGTLGRKIRHMYDLHMIIRQPGFNDFLNSNDFIDLIRMVQADDRENAEFRGAWSEKPLSESLLFKQIDSTWDKLTRVYLHDFSPLVFGTLPSPSEIKQTIVILSERLRDFDILSL